MPKLAPIKRKDLIHYLRKLGFDGPYAGSNHGSMLKGKLSLTIPNPHGGKEYSKGFLLKLLKQAEIDRDTWEKL